MVEFVLLYLVFDLWLSGGLVSLLLVRGLLWWICCFWCFDCCLLFGLELRVLLLVWVILWLLTCLGLFSCVCYFVFAFVLVYGLVF